MYIHVESHAAREHRARRAVIRLGYSLQRSRRRNPDFPDHGLYRVIDPFQNQIIVGAWPWDYSLDLDDVESWVAETTLS